MLDSAIRTISIARSSPIAAAAYFERKVQIWNFATAELISELDTVFEFGGHRLAVSPRGDCCVAASFRAGPNGGVVCYEARSGRIVWQRADLRGVQGVRFSAMDDTIWCEIADRPVQSLDAHSGLTLGSLRTIQDVYDSLFTAHQLRERRGDLILIQDSFKRRVPRLTFAILDATFSPDALCLSDAGGPVRCLDLGTAEEKWRYAPQAGCHVLGLSYQADQSFYGVEWPYGRGGPKTLLRLSQGSGAVKNVCTLNTYPDAFGFGQGNVLASSGDVVSLLTGSIVRRLAFPLENYPDEESNDEANL